MQSWILINFDTKEREGSIGDNTELGHCFWDDQSHLCTMLTPVQFPKSITNMLKRGRFALQPGPLGKLSVEVLQLIFAQFPDFHRTVVLSVTCKMMLSAGLLALHDAYQKKHRSWMGCRLICVGEEADEDELPVGLRTPDVQHELIFGSGRTFYKKPMPCTLYDVASRKYSQLDTRRNHIQMYQEASFLPSEYPGLLAQAWTVWTDQSLTPDRILVKTLYAEPKAVKLGGGEGQGQGQQTKVLCNLSKAEYFRVDGLRLRFRGEPDVGHALLSQICWSDDPDCGLPVPEPVNEELVRGPWAGDRFCVATLQDMPVPIGGMGRAWMDVTERVDGFVVRLWQAAIQGNVNEGIEGENVDEETDDEYVIDSDIEDDTKWMKDYALAQ